MSQALHGGRLSVAAREFGLSQDAFIDFSANINVLAPVISSAEWEKWRSQIARYPEADARGLRDQLACLCAVNADRILPTAGAIEALSTVLTIDSGVIPPTINYRHPDPECDLDYVPNEAREAHVDVALSNAMGLGGHNGCVLFGRVE